MAFFIFIGFVVMWYFAARYLSPKLRNKFKLLSKLRPGLVTFCLFIAPFVPELYVYYGFQAYCSVYGGITKLEPVYADSLKSDILGISWSRLFDASSLKHLTYTQSLKDSVPYSSISMSLNPDDCMSELHQFLSNNKRPEARALLEKSSSEGVCYSSELSFDEPRYLLRKNKDVYERHAFQSFFYPREVWFSKHYELFDTLTNSSKSEYVEFETDPGILASILIPMMRRYECEATVSTTDRLGNPQNDGLYHFLSKAIIKGNRNAQ